MMMYLVISWLLVSVQDCISVQQHDVALHRSAQADATFSDGLLWTASTVSVIDCAVICMSDKACISFTVTKQTSDARKECRGHSVSGGDLRSSTPSVGTKLYNLKHRDLTLQTTTHTVAPTSEAPWHQSACSDNGQCTHTDSLCFEGKCLCTPGYYYSVGSDSCLAECAQSDLQNQMVEYPLWYILGYNSQSLYSTYQECETLCLGDTTCRSMDFRYSTGRCSTSTYTPKDVPNAWTKSDLVERLYYYQRTCA